MLVCWLSDSFSHDAEDLCIISSSSSLEEMCETPNNKMLNKFERGF